MRSISLRFCAARGQGGTLCSWDRTALWSPLLPVPLAMQTPWGDMGKEDSLTLTEIGPNIPQTCLSKVSKDPLIISEHFFYQLSHARFYAGH